MILKLKPNKGLKNEVLAEQRREIEEAFRLFDHGRQGCIALKDIKIAMRALGYEPNRTEIRKFAIEKEAKG
jgi:centrin-1